MIGRPSLPQIVILSALIAMGMVRADPLGDLIAANAALQEIASDPKHEVEIRYTQIDRDAAGKPSFKTFTAGTAAGRYFYPASTVKFPAALIAIEKLRAFDVDELDLDTAMLTDTAYDWQSPAQTDPTSPSGLPSLGHYLRKIFLVSDNDAYNRVFEFAGADALNKGLAVKGYSGVRLTHRLSVGSEPWHGRHTNPIRFVDGERTLLDLPTEESADYTGAGPLPIGSAHIRRGERIREPKDFRALNAFPLAAQQEMLKALVFPDAVPERSRFAINASSRTFLLRAMGQWPSESEWPKLDPEEFHDAYVKPLVLGSEPASPPQRLRIFNKTGTAYGYLIDNAYIVDLEHRAEFLLAARIYTNANATLNDNVYEYDTIGLPFLRDLGRAVLEHERKREREHAPDLSEFDLAR